MKAIFATACAVSLGAGIINAASFGPGVNEPPAATAMLDRFLSSGQPALTSYRARRVLTASTMGGRMSATLEAWTALDPDETLSFEVVRQDGSGLLRKRVLLAALETEQRTRNHGEMAQSELTNTNYEFQVDSDTKDDGLATIRMVPRRRTPMLLNGFATIRRHDGDIVRIDGSPSKSPSWWTKHVDIVRRYDRIAGVRVPIEMLSHADVRIVGTSAFSMTYEYESVNGVTVDKAPAMAPVMRLPHAGRSVVPGRGVSTGSSGAAPAGSRSVDESPVRVGGRLREKARVAPECRAEAHSPGTRAPSPADSCLSCADPGRQCGAARPEGLLPAA